MKSARAVIAQAIWTGDLSFNLDDNYADADAILDVLAANGFHLAGPGQIVVSAEDGKELMSACLRRIAETPSRSPSFVRWIELRERLRAALRGRTADATGEGT